jgi:thioredoxin-dependent peroxiredoxin
MTDKFEPYQAPDFKLPDSKNNIVSLDDYRGKWVVLYFYPKDETPGCTIEACSLRDARETLTYMGAVVIGISRDDAESHEDFISKHKLNFILLTDAKHEVMDKYGAWGKKMYGREGILRKTFIINPDGMIVKVYNKVTPIGHGQEVIADLKKLQS